MELRGLIISLKELNIANERIINFSERKMQIYPIIIDSSINYSDDRIAEFLKNGNDSYNLRHILKPEIAARKIKTQLVKLEMAQDRIFEERKNYYYVFPGIQYSYQSNL